MILIPSNMDGILINHTYIPLHTSYLTPNTSNPTVLIMWSVTGWQWHWTYLSYFLDCQIKHISHNLIYHLLHFHSWVHLKMYSDWVFCVFIWVRGLVIISSQMLQKLYFFLLSKLLGYFPLGSIKSVGSLVVTSYCNTERWHSSCCSSCCSCCGYCRCCRYCRWSK